MVEIIPQSARDSLGTLAANTALAVCSQSASNTAAFLAKKVIMSAILDGFTAGEGPITFGMARGDASVTAIKTALEQAQVDRNAKQQGTARDVIWETVRNMEMIAGGKSWVHIEVSLGGGQGIPFDVDDGWKWFVFNHSGVALTTGAVIVCDGVVYGVWL